MVTALYRRYRPEAFAEMIGQSQVTEPLMTALRTERIGHAYLFSGPRGCGKTTSARILARCLNCAQGPTDTPCGECPSCVELSRNGGGSLDVVEIDAASHGGVDDARDLRERAVFAPARDRYKIFIIDEAHMVTAGGFNALLKIVEEPPPHVKFIFATTEPDKVIGTIRSRTHHYPFRLVAPGPLIDYVQSLCDSEGVEVEAGVLPLVVRAGGGSVRDTLSILDQLIAGSEEGRVTLDRASGLLGFTHAELLDDVIAAMGARNSAAAFTATDRVVQTGQDPRRFVEDLLQRLRDLIVVGATTVQGAAAVFRGVPEDQLQRMFEQAQSFAPGELSRLADTVSAALDRMTGATAPKLQLELMIARALVALEQNPQQPRTQAPVQQAPAASPTAAQAPTTQPPSAASATAPQSDATAQPQESAPAMNAAEAARAAREFLRTDTAGAASFGRPVTDVLGMMGESAKEPQQGPGPAQQSSESAQQSPESSGRPAPSSGPAVAQVQSGASRPEPAEPTPQQPGPATPAENIDLAELEQLWPELLEELLESDRDAWNAVRVVTPLALDGDLLTVGIASRSDLEAFKSRGAGPLRETILAALGVRVRYSPKQVAAPARPVPDEADAGAANGQQQNSAARGRSTPPAPAGETQDAEGDPDPAAGHRTAPEPTSRDESPAGPGAQAAVAPPVSAPASPQRPGPERDPIMERAAKLAALAPRAPRAEAAGSGTPASSPSRPSQNATAAPGAAAPASAAPASASPGPAKPLGSPNPSAGRAERAAALGPVGAGQAWADYEPPESTDPDDDPYADGGGDPYLSAGARQEAAPAGSRASAEHGPATGYPAAPAPPAEPAAPEPPVPGPRADETAPVREEQPRSSRAPAFTRYGEAVVREVLGAKFIEERPLPAGGER